MVENEGRKSDEPAKIRLNLDLEAEVELNAKIQGDVTLGLSRSFDIILSVVWNRNTLNSKVKNTEISSQ